MSSDSPIAHPTPGRIALISDVHACREALSATLAAIDREGITEIVCLGDVVGYGPDPAECLALISRRCRHILRGNHEAMLLSGDFSRFGKNVRIPLANARQQLSAEDLEEIRTWPMLLREPAWEAVHASMHKPETFIHMRTARDLQLHFACQSRDVCFYGHTHVAAIHFRPEPRKILQAKPEGPYDLNRPGRFAVGIGSVAYPRDGSTTASWVSYDPGSKALAFHRTEYDWETASARLRESLVES